MSEFLYHLLPKVYRERDAEQGGALRALFSVFEEEYQNLRGETRQMYANLFVETCAEWVLPYIGDLLDDRVLQDGSKLGYNQRRFVANTITYRRGKGVAAILENVAADVSGWSVQIVQYSRLLGWTQNVSDVRLERGRLVDVRDNAALGKVGTYADPLAHRPDVRPLPVGPNAFPGRHNLPNVGVLVRRLKAYPLENARPVAVANSGHYHLNRLGRDQPLFTAPRPGADLFAPAGPLQRPQPIDPVDFAKNTQQYIGPGLSLNLTHRNEKGARVDLPAGSIVAADLTDWTLPANFPDGAVAVDVVLGRIALADPTEFPELRATHYYGFSADIGGGAYPRAVAGTQTRNLASVSRQTAGSPDRTPFPDLSKAIAACQTQNAAGLIRILDNDTYTLEGSLDLDRDLTIEAAEGCFPAIRIAAGFQVQGPPQTEVRFCLNGLCLYGAVRLGSSLDVCVQDCTLFNADESGDSAPVLLGTGDASPARLTMARCLSGPLQLPRSSGRLTISDSVVGLDPNAPVPAIGSGAVPAYGPPLYAENVTFLGQVCVHSLRASNVIFHSSLEVAVAAEGFLRFSYLDILPPPGTVVETSELTDPIQYRCQPEMSRRRGAGGPVSPGFTSLTFGQPGFAQLDRRTPRAISAGAEDGSEMGAFRNLQQNRRTANLVAIMEEYLPLEKHAGIFFVT